MQIDKLDHVNLRTTQLEVMTAWYGDVLGLMPGPRPNFPFPGAWLYAGDTAVVHLIGIDAPEGIGSEQALKLEHFAFTATGQATFEDRVARMAIHVRRVTVEETGMVAYNIWDPDGNHIHVDFVLRAEDAPPPVQGRR